MHLSDLQLISDTHFCQGVDVEIDSSAAIAPGVVIRAESGGRITVSAGVCIGAGSVIQAYGGELLLEAGVSLGAGALVLGRGRIGANTCVGSAATVINPAIAANQVIAPGALIGDTSRRPENFLTAAQSLEDSATESLEAASLQSDSPEAKKFQSESPHIGSQSDSPEDNNYLEDHQAKPDANPSSNSVTPNQTAPDQNGASAQTSKQAASEQNGAATPISEQPAASDQNDADPPSSRQATNFSQVYGRQHIDQLLVALFPHRQPLNSPQSPDSS
ncbi:MAG: hypothetical protein QNJ46_24050 [Leptolyngbyaceae cyanobacterium MO_188.B28]|nr:hypothetical protein [Leptolyngbyaceae cyanobacterium MO_188.B28]